MSGIFGGLLDTCTSTQDNQISKRNALSVCLRTVKRLLDSIKGLQYFIDELDPDLAIFMILTPYPGTPLYAEAEKNGWIEDHNWANYDMIHAIMPTETLTTRQVQEELYGCYRHFYGSITRNLRGYFSSNPIKKKTYRYVANKTLLRQLKAMI